MHFITTALSCPLRAAGVSYIATYIQTYTFGLFRIATSTSISRRRREKKGETGRKKERDKG
jgi:hypothetical protein